MSRVTRHDYTLQNIVKYYKTRPHFTRQCYMLQDTVTCCKTYGNMLQDTVTCYNTGYTLQDTAHVTRNGDVLKYTVACYKALYHVTRHDHMLQVTVTCYKARLFGCAPTFLKLGARCAPGNFRRRKKSLT